MSILGAAEPNGLTAAAYFSGMLTLSVVVAAFAGVFRRRGIEGRIRIPAEEPPVSLFVAAGIGWLLLSPGIFGLIQLIRQAISSATTQPSNDQMASTQLLTIQLLNSVTLILFLGIFTHFARTADSLGLRLRQFVTAIPAAAIGALISIPLVVAATIVTDWVLHHFHHDEQLIHPMLKMLNESGVPWQEITIVLCATVAAPLAEEMLFRGYCQTLLSAIASSWFGGRMDWRTRWSAVLMTSVVFALLHPAWSWGAIFILALCLGYAYERTGNLWVPILMHASFNAFQVAFDWIINHVHI